MTPVQLKESVLGCSGRQNRTKAVVVEYNAKHDVLFVPLDIKIIEACDMSFGCPVHIVLCQISPWKNHGLDSSETT